MANLKLTPTRLAIVLAVGVVPLGIALPSPAQTPAPVAPQEFVTVCTYDSSSGLLNPLGMRAFITVREVGGNSVFRFEQFPDFVSGTDDTPDRPAEIASDRTLTLYETPLAEARQRLIDEPAYYAALLGVEPEQLAGDGFSEVNETLACQAVSPPFADVSQLPQPATPPTAPPAASLMIGDLPDGNYRVASATYPFRVVSDQELVENGGALFLFRKRGDSITGNFSYIDSEVGACITGTLAARNAILGRASIADKTGVVTNAETGVTFLGPADYLQLGETVTGDRYESSILTLEGFSRINAGAVLPPESCP